MPPPPASSAALPMVWVLDIDHTIVGDVGFQSHRHALRRTLSKHGIKVHPAAAAAAPPSAAYAPHSPLVRPGLAEFLDAARRVYSPEECFVFLYTASERGWAHQEIKWLEEEHAGLGVKFERPIFTRDDCIVTTQNGRLVGCQKSIARVFPRICRAVAKRRGRALSPAEREAVLATRLVVVDDSPNVYIDHADRVLGCPSYELEVFEDMEEGLTPEQLAHPLAARCLATYAAHGLACPRPAAPIDLMRHRAARYAWIAQTCREVARANKRRRSAVVGGGDRFWLVMADLLLRNRPTRFSPRYVAKLQAFLARASGCCKHDGHARRLV